MTRRRKKHRPEEIVGKLRDAAVFAADHGKLLQCEGQPGARPQPPGHAGRRGLTAAVTAPWGFPAAGGETRPGV